MCIKSRIDKINVFRRFFSLTTVTLGIAGCTLDSLVVLRHPGSVPVGETFQVGAVNVILDVSSAQSAADSVFRDSLHVGVGLPSGWTVVSAKACPAPHFRPAKASVNDLDTNKRNQLLLDTLDACEGRAVPLTPDSGVRAFLAGRTIRVPASPESLGTSFNIKPDTVPNWFGFGGRIEVHIPAGSPADTIMDSTDSPAIHEPTAFKALPVYVYLTLQAGPRDTAVRLLYFSKTGRLDTAGIRNNTNLDKGALVYHPLVVTSPVSAAPRSAASGFRWVSGGPSIRRAASGLLTLRLPPAASGATGRGGLEVLSASGARLRSWSAPALGASGEVQWDGTDAAGRPLRAGRYLLRAVADGIHRVQPFVLMP
jgi:hypothetical protein